jgi:hypothetical protein
MTKKEAKQIEDAIISLSAYRILINNAVEKKNNENFKEWCAEHDKVNLELRSMGINIGKTYKELDEQLFPA